MGQLSLLRYMMFKCSKVSLQSLLQPQCRSIVLNATSASAINQSHSCAPQLEDPVFKTPASTISRTEIQPALAPPVGTESLVVASGIAQTAQLPKVTEANQSQTAQRKEKGKPAKTAAESSKKECAIKLCAVTQTKPAIKKPQSILINKRRANSTLRGQKIVKAPAETAVSIQGVTSSGERRSGEKIKNGTLRKRAPSKGSNRVEVKIGATSKIKSGAARKTTAPEPEECSAEVKSTSDETMRAQTDSKVREMSAEKTEVLQSSLTAPTSISHTPETVPSSRSVTFADPISVVEFEKSTAPTPVTTDNCSQISAFSQNMRESQEPPTQYSALATELVNIGESVNSSAVAPPGQPLVLDTASGPVTCIGLETVVTDGMRHLEQAQGTKAAIAKAWSIFSPDNRLRRLIEEDSKDDGNGAHTIRRTSSILENGIRQIRRRLPSAYHHPGDGSLLPFRDTLTSLARRDYSLRRIKALRIIQESGGTIPSPARISIDRQLQNEYRDNRASILKIKFVTNQWVVPSYIVEHFEKFHKPPFQPNGNIDEKRITDSVTIVLKLSQTLFLENTPT